MKYDLVNEFIMSKVIVPENCFFQGCYNPEFETEIEKCKNKCYEYNKLNPNDRKAQTKILKTLLGKMGKEVIITPPFWCDYGYHIEVGDYFYSNHNMIITDGATVKFGNNVFVAPNVCITTAEHAIDPNMRKAGIEIAKSVTVGNNVWIGAGSTILAGAKIGDNSVIGAGSVVKGEIPANTVAVGVPCKPIRKITEADRQTYPLHDSLKQKNF